MLDQELEVSVRARRWTCVVDPLLALSTPLGAQLVQRLAPVVELWMVRGFWQALDSSEYYRRDPLSLWPSESRNALPPDTADDVMQALRFWEDLRARHDMACCGMHWVCDNLSESCLPDTVPANLCQRYESLHQGLAQRADPRLEATETGAFFGAMDTLALAAALGQARILTLAKEDKRAYLPAICEALDLEIEAPGLPRLAAAERRHFGEFIIHAGATGLAWAAPPLALAYAVLPVAVPQVQEIDDYANRVHPESLPAQYTMEYEDEAPRIATVNPWHKARIFLQDGWR